MPPETNPRLVFERLFGDIDTSLVAGGPRAARCATAGASSTSSASGRTSCRPTSGRPTSASSTSTCPSIREIERRIERAENDMTGLRRRPSTSRPASRSLYADYVKLMFDLQVIAFQTDLTRVVTMMIGREGSMRTYPEIGVPDPHHPLTHHRGNAEWIEKVDQDQHAPHGAVRLLHREAEGHAGRRRHAARPLDDRLRQRPQRRQPPHARRPAGAARRRAAAASRPAATSSTRRTRR